MRKQAIIRGRINDVLRQRVDDYIRRQEARGLSMDDSEVVRRAIVGFLDAEEKQQPRLERPAYPRPSGDMSVNEEAPNSNPAEERAIVALVKKNAEEDHPKP